MFKTHNSSSAQSLLETQMWLISTQEDYAKNKPKAEAGEGTGSYVDCVSG